MNVALCFCACNCEPYLQKIFSNIELVKTLSINVFSIFVYDNCSDNTKYILEEYQKKNPNSVIVRNIINTRRERTVRIAKARNECLKIVYNELDNISFHMMIDCDDVCAPKWNIDIIDKYLNNFDNDNWDCISFNRTVYYDIWALMFDDFKHHCWGFGPFSRPVIKIMRNHITNKLNNCETNSIEVISAFNGFCIYKTNKFRGFYYDGLYSNIKPLITQNERDNVERLFKEKYNLNVKCLDEPFGHAGGGYQCCEHLFYHLSAFKNGRKIKISKFKVV